LFLYYFIFIFYLYFQLGPVRVTLRTRAELAEWDRLAADGDHAAAQRWVQSLGERRGGRANAAVRWHVGAASEGRPKGLVPWTGPPPPGAVVHVASLPLHRGLVPHVADGLADISLCLSLERQRAAVGDLVLVMAAAAPRHPRPYVTAARAAEAEGVSTVVAALRVSAVYPLGLYCRRFGSRTWRGGRGGRARRVALHGAPRPRASAMYRRVARTAPGARQAYDGRFYAPRARARLHGAGDPAPGVARGVVQDLSGLVLLATSWRAWGASLEGAPRASPGFKAWLIARWDAMRGGRATHSEVPEDAAVFAFVETLRRGAP